MQLTTKNGLNWMKNKGVIAVYVKYAKSVFFGSMVKNDNSMILKILISMYTYILCIHTKSHAN